MSLKKIISILIIILLALSFYACDPDLFNNDNDDDGDGDSSTRYFYMGTTPGSRTKEQFTLAYQNEKANVWIKSNKIGTEMSEELLTHYGDYFEDHSWPDVTTYVYKPTEFFGEEGDRINIIFYNDSEGIAGYFWGYDFYSNSASDVEDSNETNVFYMAIEAATYNEPNGTDDSKLFTEGTLTHEFQHMCNAHYFRDNSQLPLDTWANEMSSVLMETMFAGQVDIYVPAYHDDSNFENGVYFIKWDNFFAQYTAVSLFGTYLTSQLDEANQKSLITTLLKKSGSGNTSIHDLVVTLEDSDVGYWSSSTSPTSDSAVQTKWSDLMGDFLNGLVRNEPTYISFLNSLSSEGSISISPVTTTSGTKTLNASAWVIAEVNNANLDSTEGCDNEGSDLAYMIAYHDGLPAWGSSGYYEMPKSYNTCDISTAKTVKKANPYSDYKPYKYNRSMTPVFDYPTVKKSSNTSKAVVDGTIKYFYVGR
ncbi:MAG: M30 family zinc metallopeptidase [Spirochaetota bacterium]